LLPGPTENKSLIGVVLMSLDHFWLHFKCMNLSETSISNQPLNSALLRFSQHQHTAGGVLFYVTNRNNAAYGAWNYSHCLVYRQSYKNCKKLNTIRYHQCDSGNNYGEYDS